MVLCINYQSVMKLSRVRIRFFLSEITGPRWLELLIARTHFDSHFEFEPAKFYCINIHLEKNTDLKNESLRIFFYRFIEVKFYLQPKLNVCYFIFLDKDLRNLLMVKFLYHLLKPGKSYWVKWWSMKAYLLALKPNPKDGLLWSHCIRHRHNMLKSASETIRWNGNK